MMMMIMMIMMTLLMLMMMTIDDDNDDKDDDDDNIDDDGDDDGDNDDNDFYYYFYNDYDNDNKVDVNDDDDDLGYFTSFKISVHQPVWINLTQRYQFSTKITALGRCIKISSWLIQIALSYFAKTNHDKCNLKEGIFLIRS